MAFDTTDAGIRAVVKPVEWPAEYVGLPFKLNGRDRNGLDCWGLVRLVMHERAGIFLPLWDTVTEYDDADRVISRERDKPMWVPVEQPQAFDVIEMRGVFRSADGKLRHGRVHCGICVGQGRILHVERDTNSCLVRYEALRKRAPRAWRHRSMI